MYIRMCYLCMYVCITSQGVTFYYRLSQNSLCEPGWSQLSNPPATAFLVLDSHNTTQWYLSQMILINIKYPSSLTYFSPSFSFFSDLPLVFLQTACRSLPSQAPFILQDLVSGSRPMVPIIFLGSPCRTNTHMNSESL